MYHTTDSSDHKSNHPGTDTSMRRTFMAEGEASQIAEACLSTLVASRNQVKLCKITHPSLRHTVRPDSGRTVAAAAAAVVEVAARTHHLEADRRTC
jgi:hypothetical protein